MTINVVQETNNFSASATNVASFSKTFASNAQQGNSLLAYIVITNNHTGVTVSNAAGDTWHQLTNLNETNQGRFVLGYYASNIAGGANSSTITVTYNDFSDHQWVLVIAEIGTTTGNDTSATAPSQGGQIQLGGTYTAGTDDWTTGGTKFAPSTAPGLAYCYSYCTNDAPTTAAGTGFTQGQIFTPVGGGQIGGQVFTENKRYTTNTSFAMTVSQTANTTAIGVTVGALFIETGPDTLLGQAIL